MFERYSDPAQRIIASAGEEARLLGHAQIGTEHLLLGLLTEADSPAIRALPPGTTIEVARRKVAEAVGTSGSGGASAGAGAAAVTDADADADLSFTSRAKRALERASRFSRQRHDAEVGTIHVLLGVLDVEGRAGQVLRGLGVDVGRLREAAERTAVRPSRTHLVDHAVQANSRAPAAVAGPDNGNGAAARERPTPRCAVCGAPLDTALASRLLAAEGEDGSSRAFVVAYCSACGSALGATPT